MSGCIAHTYLVNYFMPVTVIPNSTPHILYDANQKTKALSTGKNYRFLLYFQIRWVKSIEAFHGTRMCKKHLAMMSVQETYNYRTVITHEWHLLQERAIASVGQEEVAWLTAGLNMTNTMFHAYWWPSEVKKIPL